MIDRRGFLALCAVSLLSCGRDDEERLVEALGLLRVTLYDTYAMALYFDGSLGPKTGVMKVDYVKKNEPVTLRFWHGHGGESHFFTLTPDHFSEVKKLKKVTIETTEVASHTHKLFIDPNHPKYRVPGALPVEVA